MIKSILTPLDGSIYTDTILQYAVYLSKKFSAPIRILNVIDIRLTDIGINQTADSFVSLVPSVEFQTESRKILEDKSAKIISKASKILEKEGVQFEAESIIGLPVDEICDYAMQNDLVVMGARGEYEKWTKKFIGDTVELVSRQISKPLFIVEKKFTKFERIQIGYDGSVHANNALQIAAFLAKSFNIQLQVIAVFDTEDERAAVLNEAERYLTPYEISFHLRHETGHAADRIISASKNSPVSPITVIGSYGHSRLREAIIGSTTVEVMRNAEKPILITK
jgi:nucleotide-binding universal stress UspA family protein